MSYDIPARSRLIPSIPITSPQFLYRRARETDVQATFARVRAELEHLPNDQRTGVMPPERTQLPATTNPA
jgi:hypothetical protein